MRYLLCYHRCRHYCCLIVFIIATFVVLLAVAIVVVRAEVVVVAGELRDWVSRFHSLCCGQILIDPIYICIYDINSIITSQKNCNQQI